MAAIIGFVFYVLGGLLSLVTLLILVSVVLSWLIAFDIINTRNPTVYNIVRALDGFSRPILRPFQRIIPPLGGVDISPVLALLVLGGVQNYLLPALKGFLLNAFT
jgi:YggT family protein